MGVGAGAGRGGAHPLTRVRLALHPRLPPNKHTRSRTPAQRCTHACHLISTPTHVQHMPAALMSACSGWAGVLGRGGRGWGGWGGVGWGTAAHARPPISYVHTTERQGNMQLSTPLSLLVHSSKHCVYKRSGAKKARVQRRSGPACTDDPNSACTDDALTPPPHHPPQQPLEQSAPGWSRSSRCSAASASCARLGASTPSDASLAQGGRGGGERGWGAGGEGGQWPGFQMVVWSSFWPL